MKFNSEDEFRQWKHYYQIFSTPDGQEVLKDLADYSCILNDAFSSDPYILAAREGRKQVFLRIIRNLHLDLEQLFNIYKGRTVIFPHPDQDEE